LNTAIAFCFVTECLNIAVLYCTWLWPVQELAPYFKVVLYEALWVSEQ